MNDMDTILLSCHFDGGGVEKFQAPWYIQHSSRRSPGDLRAQSLPGAQNPLLYDRQADPLEMTMRRVAYCH